MQRNSAVGASITRRRGAKECAKLASLAEQCEALAKPALQGVEHENNTVISVCLSSRVKRSTFGLTFPQVVGVISHAANFYPYRLLANAPKDWRWSR